MMIILIVYGTLINSASPTVAENHSDFKVKLKLSLSQIDQSWLLSFHIKTTQHFLSVSLLQMLGDINVAV